MEPTEGSCLVEAAAGGVGWVGHAPTPMGRTKLQDYDRVVRLLLEDGRVDVDLPNLDGRTALRLAAQNNACERVLLLLQHGADPAVQDRWKIAPKDRPGSLGCRRLFEVCRLVLVADLI